MPPPLTADEKQAALDLALSDVAWAHTTRLAGRRGTLAVHLITYPTGEPFPRIRAMGWLHDGWVFYMSTRATSLKAREVAANPNVSVLCIDQTRRSDAFIQVDCCAVRVHGEEFLAWQERRYRKEGDNLRRATDGMTEADWNGWRLEPVRVRALGYCSLPGWSEAPIVATRTDLGLPPLAV